MKKLVLIVWLVLVVEVGCAVHIPTSVQTWRAGLTTVVVEGERMAYLDAGPKEGEVIVLLHRLPTSSYLYHQVVPDLVKQGYRVIAPDLVGYGASSKPSDEAAYAYDVQAKRVLALLDSLGIQQFSFVVHDIGGLVGWEMLDQQGGRVKRLLVLNTTAYAGFHPPAQMRMLAGPLSGMMSSMMGGGMMGESLTASFIKDNTGTPAKVDAGFVANFWWSLHEGATRPTRNMARRFGRIQTEFPRYQAALRRFTGPALVLWGGRDHVLNFATIAQQFGADLRLPAESVRVIPDAGHFLMIDHPEIVTAAILELMKRPENERSVVPSTDATIVHIAPAGVGREPAPGPTLRGAFDLGDRFTPSTMSTARKHVAGVGLRLRGLLGQRWGYALGVDGEFGWSEGAVYRVAAYPAGVGFAAHGHYFALSGGIGVHDTGAATASLELPLNADAALQLGPVSLLTWARLAWVPNANDTMQWRAALGLRWGRAREYFPGALLGAGPYVAATVDGVGEQRSYGAVLGFDFADGH